MCKNYFEKRTPPKCKILFRVNNKVENEYATTTPASAGEIENLEKRCGFSNCSLHSKR